MANMTLSDFVKTMEDSKSKTVISTYAMSTHVTMMMPMVDEPTGIYKYTIEHDLPHSDSTTNATRVLNADFTATKASVQPFAVNYKVYGGRITFDRAAAAVNKAELARQQRLQVQAKARQFTKDVFEGDGGRGLFGIKNIIDSYDVYKSQIVYAGTSSTGAALTEDMLDDAISKHNMTPNTYIYTTRKVANRIKKMSRGNGGGTAYDSYNTVYSPVEFGTFTWMYNSIPIVPIIDGKGNDILDTTSDICNVYIVTYGADENFTGFQVQPITTHDLEGTSAVKSWDIEHLVGTAPQAQKCVTMIKYVANSVS